VVHGDVLVIKRKSHVRCHIFQVEWPKALFKNGMWFPGDQFISMLISFFFSKGKNIHPLFFLFSFLSFFFFYNSREKHRGLRHKDFKQPNYVLGTDSIIRW
jgi:hypothetical protein